jgi:trimeric autotransporter adhesin
MKKTFLVLTFVLISALALSAFAPISFAGIGQQQQMTSTAGAQNSGQSGSSVQANAPSPFFLSQVLGLDLRGRRSAVYGQVHGFVVDPVTGQIMYVIASTDGPQGTAMTNPQGIGVTGSGSSGTSSLATSAPVSNETSTAAPTTSVGGTAASTSTPAATTAAGGSAAMTDTPAASGSAVTDTPAATATSSASGSSVTDTPAATSTTSGAGAAAETSTPASTSMAAGTVTSTPGTVGVPATGQSSSGQYVLLPWSAVDLNANARPDNDPNTPIGARAFYLALNPLWIARGPSFDLASLNDLANGGWDVKQRAYWNGIGVPVTGMSNPGTGMSGTGGTTATATPSANTSGTSETATPSASTSGLENPSGNQERAAMNPILMDSVNKIAVSGMNGENLGTVKDIILQPKSGRLLYVVLSQPNGCLLPVPWRQLDWSQAFNSSGVPQTGAEVTATPAAGTSLATSTPLAALTDTPTVSAGASGSMTDTPAATVSAAGSMTDTPAAAASTAMPMTDTPASGAAVATATAVAGSAGLSTSTSVTGTEAPTSTTTAGTTTDGSTGLGVGNTYTVRLNIDPNTLSSAPCFGNNISDFDPYRDGWDTNFLSFWGHLNGKGTNAATATPTTGAGGTAASTATTTGGADVATATMTTGSGVSTATTTTDTGTGTETTTLAP